MDHLLEARALLEANKRRAQEIGSGAVNDSLLEHAQTHALISIAESLELITNVLTGTVKARNTNG